MTELPAELWLMIAYLIYPSDYKQFLNAFRLKCLSQDPRLRSRMQCWNQVIIPRGPRTVLRMRVDSDFNTILDLLSKTQCSSLLRRAILHKDDSSISRLLDNGVSSRYVLPLLFTFVLPRNIVSQWSVSAAFIRTHIRLPSASIPSGDDIIRKNCLRRIKSIIAQWVEHIEIKNGYLSGGKENQNLYNNDSDFNESMIEEAYYNTADHHVDEFPCLRAIYQLCKNLIINNHASLFERWGHLIPESKTIDLQFFVFGADQLLRWAIINGSLKLARDLMEIGAAGRNITHLIGSLDKIKLEMIQLLTEFGFDINRIPSHLLSSDVGSVKLYIACGLDGKGNRALLLDKAVRDGREDTARYLLTIDSKLYADNYAKQAIEANNESMVKLLLEFRKNSQNTMDLDAAQLLTIASEKGYQNLVHLLLQNQISVRNPYCHAIQQSAAKGHVEILKILLKAFGGPGEQVNNALHSASAVGNMECVKLLVEFGAEPACNDHKALKEAFRRRHIEVAQYLLNCYQVNSEVLARIKREAKQVNYYDLAY